MRNRIYTSDNSGKYTLTWYIGQGDMDLYLEVTDSSTGEVKTIKASDIENLEPGLRATALSLLKMMVRTSMALIPWLHVHGYDWLLDQLDPIGTW